MEIPILTKLNVHALIGEPIVRQALQTFKTHVIYVDCDQDVSEDKVFEALFSAVGTASFCPTNIKRDSNSISFYVQKCLPAIEKLVRHNLIIKAGIRHYDINIRLCYKIASNKEVIPCDFLHRLFLKRIQGNTINLEGIVNEINRQGIYMSTNNLYSLGAYLNQFITSNPLVTSAKFTSVRLGNCELKSLYGIKYFLAFANLTSFNLKNNLLEDVSVLEHSALKTLAVTDLWLDGNPLCDKYLDEETYIDAVKIFCPNLLKLDGNLLKIGLPQSRRNFLCDDKAAKLVDQFMEHYFTVFDINRKNLLDLYDSQSLFSLSCSFTSTMLALSFSANMFHSSSRNILRLSDLTKGEEQLHKGAESICRFLNVLPKMQHDPYSFTTDIIHHSSKNTIIMVTGMFRIVSSDVRTDVYYNFSRTFNIRHCGDNQYKIFNEQLYITNLMAECPKNFTKAVPARLSELMTSLGEPDQEEKTDMCKMLSNITQKSEKECECYLNNSKWDMAAAINLFINDFSKKSS